MAVEISNVIHALAVLHLNPAPSVARGAGIASVSRQGVGVYEVAAEPALDITEGMGQANLLEGSGGTVTVSVRDHLSFGPQNILISTFNAAGAPADIGFTALTLYRFPTQS